MTNKEHVYRPRKLIKMKLASTCGCMRACNKMAQIAQVLVCSILQVHRHAAASRRIDVHISTVQPQLTPPVKYDSDSQVPALADSDSTELN